jgi:septal ring factor EnvC (AmiA/AmiB activator)
MLQPFWIHPEVHTLYPMPMICRPFLFLTVAAISLSGVSCGEDPALVRKRDEQRAEITKLESELALLKEKLKDLPEDRSKELAAAKAKAAAQAEDLARLETEIAAMEKEKSELEKKFSDYRSKYVLKTN